MKRILFCLFAISMCVVMATSCCCCDDTSSSSDSNTNVGDAFQKGFKYGWNCESARQESSKGNYDKAISLYKEAISLDPEDKEAYIGLGQVYLTQANYDEAIKNFQKALEIAPDDSSVQSLLDTAKAKGQ